MISKTRSTCLKFAVIDGQVVPSTGTVEYTYFNQNGFKSLGSTARFKGRWNNLDVNFGITGIGRFNLLSGDFTEVPPFSFLVESSAQFKYHFPRPGIDINLMARNYDKRINYFSDVDDQENPAILQNVRDGYTLVDANISKAFFRDNIKLIVGAKNMLNIRDVNFMEQSGGSHGSGGGSVPVSWGRSFFIAINTRLAVK